MKPQISAFLLLKKNTPRAKIAAQIPTQRRILRKSGEIAGIASSIFFFSATPYFINSVLLQKTGLKKLNADGRSSANSLYESLFA